MTVRKIAAAAGWILLTGALPAQNTAPNSDARHSALLDFGRLPIVFEPNQGQTDPSVKFLARTEGATLFLTEREAVLSLRGAHPVRMRLAGAKKPQAIRGLEPTGGISNYFLGNDQQKWQTAIPHYNRVEYKSVYAGVDVVYYGNPQKLEYDLVIAPGADAGSIQMEYEGIESLRLDADGDLILTTPLGELRQKRPVAYQETSTGRVNVEAAYRLNGQRVAFQLARYDAGRRLVIDPVFVYSTYLGGGGIDVGYGIAIDSLGNAYVTGPTSSTNFPTNNPLQAANGGNVDAFVTKINAAGSARVYSTYLGGSGDDGGFSIAVDSSENAYVTGYTSSTDFPTINPLQASNGGGEDAFVTKINAAGSARVYSTYLGGSGTDRGQSIAVDGSDNAYVTGITSSTNFPTSNPLQPVKGGGVQDAFVTKINTAGSAYVYSTYLGGSGNDQGYGIAIDALDAAYVTGLTASTNFPTTNPLQANNAGGNDVFVTKINAAGSAHVYSTYLGGSGIDQGFGIGVDGSHNVYITGNTTSSDFPTASPLQASSGGGSDVFVAKINAAGSSTVYSTYLGGNGQDYGYGIAVDGSNAVYVTGLTASTNFPTANPLQVNNGGGTDAFASKINPGGSALVYSTYLGAPGEEYGQGIAVDFSGNTAYLTGYTTSANFPTTNPLQASMGGGLYDAFVLSIFTGNVVVPDVVGMTKGAATTAITGAGLVLGAVTTAFSNSVPGGNVISESPVAGTQVNLGSAVDLVISGSQPVSVTPPAGSGLAQTMTFAFDAPDGFASLSVVNVLINNAINGIAACYVAFVPSTGSLFLVDDGGNAGGPYVGMTLPGSGTIQNSQCSIAGTGSSFSGSGNTLTLTLAITFNASFAGNKVIYMAAQDNVPTNSGWQTIGVWNVPGPVPPGPSVGGVSPGNGNSATQTYTFTFNNTNGFADLAVMNVLINNAINGIAACYIAFVPSGPTAGSIYLVNDAGSAGGPFAGMVLPGSGSVSNSQCTIDGTGSSVSGSGNTLTLILNMTLKPAFAGNKVIYMAARSNSLNSDWQPMGTVNVP